MTSVSAARSFDPVVFSSPPLPAIAFTGFRAGDLEVRLAATEAEIRAAQTLRYRIFYEEMTAVPGQEQRAARRDFDRFDEACDHLLILNHAVEGEPAIIGTYRLLRRAGAAQVGGFYTAQEFDIGPLLAVPGEILELGRACVDAAFRTGPVMQLLWRGIAGYVLHHQVRVMFGCASLPGTDPEALAPLLTYLHHNHLVPESLHVRAVADRYIEMDRMAVAEVDSDAAIAVLNARATIAALPPLLKGYLRLGALIGDGAVIDHEFGTTDVCIIVVTDRLAEKYFAHFLKHGG